MLRFTGYGSLTIPTTASTAGSRYRPTSAFDIDPLLGSTATPGFAEYAAFYNFYRVTASKITVEFVNTSAAQGVTCVVAPLTSDPGASPTTAQVNSYLEQPYAKHRLVGTSGSPAAKFVIEMSTEKITGSKLIYFDDNWNSGTATTPINNWYWALGVIAPSTPAANQVVNIMFDIFIGCEFFGRKSLQQ